jgi:hypothetical protein
MQFPSNRSIPVNREWIGHPIVVVYNPCGGENGPVTVAAFKAADSALRGSNGGFDSHTPPPTCLGPIVLRISSSTAFWLIVLGMLCPKTLVAS